MRSLALKKRLSAAAAPTFTALAAAGMIGWAIYEVSKISSSTDGAVAETFTNKSLQGTFTSTNNRLGHWTLSPTSCLTGRELGFQGISFQFAVGSPVEEIRLDTARHGDNVVDVRLADR